MRNYFKGIFCLILFFVINTTLMAQLNLIPNYSFEEMDSCPSGNEGYLGIDNYSKNWFTPIKYMPVGSIYYGFKGESDLFTTCSKSSVGGVPKNTLGFQYPYIDSSYAGIKLRYPQWTPNGWVDIREYIEVKLNSSLSADKKYCLEFYYSIAEALEWVNLTYLPAPLEVLFSDTLVYFEDSKVYFPQWGVGYISTTPQISKYTPTNIDTINWIKYEGEYTAKGDENYIIIGNFDPIGINNHFGNFIYIDAVKLWYCGPDTTPPLKEMIFPNVFTPNDDGKNDLFKYQNQEDWNFTTQIFNRWGEMIYNNSYNENWDGIYKGKKVPEGVYFYFVQAVSKSTKEIKQYKGSVSLFY